MIRIKTDPVQRPHLALSTVCEEVPYEENVKPLCAALRKPVQKHRGLGLAANQLAVTKRVIVFNFEGVWQIIVNPEITSRFG